MRGLSRFARFDHQEETFVVLGQRVNRPFADIFFKCRYGTGRGRSWSGFR